MSFDIDGARKAGYSDDEIADFLSQQSEFDLAGAKQAGYSSSDVIGFLSAPTKPARMPLPVGMQPSEAGAGRGGAEFAATDPRRIAVQPGASVGRRFRGETPPPPEPEQEVIGQGPQPTAGQLLERPSGLPASEGDLIQMSKSPELQRREAAASAPKPSLQNWKPTQAERAGEIVRSATGSQAAGSAAMRAADAYMLAPEAVVTGAKVVADIANLGTLGGAQPVSDWLGAVAKTVQGQKSPRYQAQQAELGRLLQDDNAGVLDVVEFLSSNPAFMAELGIPSLPSVLVGAGAGRAAGAINAALTARRGGGAAEVAAAYRSGAVVGAGGGNVAMNAGETFSETDGDVVDKLLAAVPAAAGTALAARLPGAERVLSGSGAAGSRTVRAGATAAAEGLQEGAESLSQSLGKGAVEGNFEPGAAVKQAVVEAGAGGVIGGMAGVVSAAPPGPAPVYDVEALARSKGFLGGQPAKTSFTPPDSEVARSGITPVEVAVAPGAAPQVAPSAGITPAAGGRPDFTRALAAVDERLEEEPTHQGTANPVEPAGQGSGQGSNPDTNLVQGDGRGRPAPQAQEGAEGAGSTQPLTPSAQPAPAATWTGRRGDGYISQADAEQALPGRQKKQPDLAWRVDPRPDGKFVLNGYALTTTSETTDVGQQPSPVAERAGAVVRARQQDLVGDGQPVGGAAPGQVRSDVGGGFGGDPLQRELGQPGRPAGADAVGGADAPRIEATVAQADLRSIERTRKQRGGEEIVLSLVPDDKVQPEVRAFAAAFGRPVAMIRDVTGRAGFGAVVMNKDRIYINAKLKDAPLKLTVHEIVHTLPAGIRESLVERAMQHTTPALKDKFLWKYEGYKNLDEAKQNEEMVAMFAQDDAKTPAFWESLRGKLGDSDFGKLAKHILSVIDKLMAKVRPGDDRKFFTDIEAVRDLVTTALAKAERGETYWADDLETSGDGGMDVQEISAEEAGFSETADDIVSRAKKAGVRLDVNESPRRIDLMLIERDPAKTKPGDGRRVMQDLLDYADATKKRIYLDVKGDAGQLGSYYSGMGFEAVDRVPGRPDWEAGMMRAPGKGAAFSEEARDYKLDVQRAERDQAKSAGLSKAEADAIAKDGASLGLTKEQVDSMLVEARETRKRFPVRAGWAPIEATGIAAERDKKTKEIKVDKKGRPKISVKWRPISYGFNVPAGKDRAPPKHDRELAKKVSQQFTSMVKDIFRRAEAGDKNAQTIVGHQTWYRNVAEILRREFGSQGDLFSDLLGATSPNTPVDTNWRFAIEILTRFSKGEFDAEMDAFIAHIDGGGRPSDFEGEKIRQASGKLYGMNSTNSMIALANLWRNIEPGSAPKARNFALNLIGQSNMATIDVWAARMLRRAADRVRGMRLPRIPTVAEQGVSGTWNAAATDVSGEFGFGALVLDMVSADLKKDGIDMPPPDLQALAWFAEKELWTENNWTSVQGEGGSFEENIEKNPTSRYLSGFSVQQGEVQPEAGVVSAAQARLLTTLRGDDTVVAARVLPTYGMFMGKPEEALDIEWTVERGQHDPSLFLAEASRIAKERTQMAIFVSRVMQPDEENSNARPGAEVYFKTGVGVPRVREIMQTFTERGLDGFTLSVDPRAKLGERPGDKYIGVRIQYVPEFDDNASPENVEQILREKEDQLQDAVRTLRQDPGVAYAQTYQYDTEVVSGDRYDEYIDRSAAEANSPAGSEAWARRSVRERLEGAAARIQSDAGQDRQGSVPDAGGADRAAFSESAAGDRGRRQEAGSGEALDGAPRVNGATGPDQRLVAVAERYARSAGLTLTRQASYVDVDITMAKRLAQAYEDMPHAPQDPAVREAYQNLIKQTTAQYQALSDAGYRFYFFDSNNDPYQGNPWNAMRDLRANQVMGVFATEAGFGSGATDLNVEDNPLLADTGITWPAGSLDGRPKRVLANDLFRAVHDAFGHGLEGAGFRARGEENAWQAHARLFTGSALAALTSETRGQNSWLNFGPHGEKNQTARVEDTVFADQKTGLMPAWAWEDGVQFSEAASLLAPNGRPSKLTTAQYAQVRTPAFKRWFGDWEKFAGVPGGVWADGNGEVSKAVDDNGEPLVVYHGTDNAGFAEFKRPGGGKRGDLGIFTTSDRRMAGSYVRRGRARPVTMADIDEDSRGSGVYAAFINIRNPGEDDFEGANWDGGRNEQWVVEIGGEQQYEADGRGYFDSKEDAFEFAKTFLADEEVDENGDDAAWDYVRGADDHYNSTDSVVSEARAGGQDGAIIRNVKDDGGGNSMYAGEPADVFVAFDPGQLKSADFNTGTFDPANPDIRFSESPWYSALAKAIEKGPNQAPAEQWRAFLKGLPSKGVKQDEITWSGVEEWLGMQQGKVPRQAVLDYLNTNGVSVEEVVLGDVDDSDMDAYQQEDNSWNIKRISDGAFIINIRGYKDDPEGAIEAAKRSQHGKLTKYGQYTLPGGENYREVLLTLPERRPLTEAWRAAQEKYGDEDQRTIDAKKAAKAEAGAQKQAYKSNHWDAPNILAHIRLNDRTDADGKRVLLVEEIQSDFGQDFKKQRNAIAEAVDSDFNGIVERMKKAGVLEVDCD